MDLRCVGCNPHYYSVISDYFEKNDNAIEFLRAHGVLPRAVNCPHCDLPCKYREDRHTWYCGRWKKIAKTKRRKSCVFSISDYSGTFLQGTHLAPYKVVLFVNHWLQKYWDHQTVTKCIGMSRPTSVDWRSFCSEVTQNWWLQNQNSIGGAGIIVEIDETLLVRRKYNRGRQVSHVWVFGGIERVSKKKFIVPLVDGDRSADTLIPLIKKYIKPDSMIYSDKWAAYRNLKHLGYKHLSINHSENFVDPHDPQRHTQNIERLWRDLKEWIRRPGIRAEYLPQYIARYLFIKENSNSPLHSFFVEAASLYPPQGGVQRDQPSPVPVPLDEGTSSDSE